MATKTTTQNLQDLVKDDKLSVDLRAESNLQKEIREDFDKNDVKQKVLETLRDATDPNASFITCFERIQRGLENLTVGRTAEETAKLEEKRAEIDRAVNQVIRKVLTAKFQEISKVDWKTVEPYTIIGEGNRGKVLENLQRVLGVQTIEDLYVTHSKDRSKLTPDSLKTAFWSIYSDANVFNKDFAEFQKAFGTTAALSDAPKDATGMQGYLSYWQTDAASGKPIQAYIDKVVLALTERRDRIVKEVSEKEKIKTNLSSLVKETAKKGIKTEDVLADVLADKSSKITDVTLNKTVDDLRTSLDALPSDITDKETKRTVLLAQALQVQVEYENTGTPPTFKIKPKETQSTILTALQKIEKEGDDTPDGIDVGEVKDITTLEALKKHQTKWGAVVDSFRNNALSKGEDKDLNWPGDTLKPLVAKDVTKFKAFAELMRKGVLDVTTELDLKIAGISYTGDAELKAAAEKLTLDLVGTSGALKNVQRPLFFHILGRTTEDLEAARNALMDRISARKKADTPKEDPRTMKVEEIAGIKSVEDIRRLRDKWESVTDKWGRRPSATETDLYWRWKDKDIEDSEKEKMKLTTGTGSESEKYKEYRNFLKEEGTYLNDLRAGVAKIAGDIDLKNIAEKELSSKALDDKIGPKAEGLLAELLRGKSDPEKYLLYELLHVKGLSGGRDKIINLVKVDLVSSVRHGKEVYSVDKDKDGKEITIPLADVLREHGDWIVDKSHETLHKLHELFGKDASLPEFRDALINIIKTKGKQKVTLGKKELTTIETENIYLTLLILKDKNLGEKEILQILITFKEKPPFVYDLINDTKGWKLGSSPKTGKGVLEDFCIDASMYSELREKLSMPKKEFNEWIKKIAPVFELLRSAIAEGKPGSLDTVKREAGLTDADVDKFRKLMEVPLWPEKIGGAYKHSFYDDGERQVPQIKEHQGPDILKLDFMAVNIEEKLQRIAERIADERLDQEMKEIGPQGWGQLWRVDKIVAKWWKRNALEAYRQQYTNDIKARLKGDPKYRTELMSLNPVRSEVKPGYGAKWSDKTPAEGERANLNTELDAIAERFGLADATGQREDYLVQKDDKVEEIRTVESLAISEALKRLCKDYMDGTINDATFKLRMRSDVLDKIKKLSEHRNRDAQHADTPEQELVSYLESSVYASKSAIDQTKIENIQQAGLLDKLKAHRNGLVILDLENLGKSLKIGIAKNVDVKTQTKDLTAFDRTTRRMVEHMQRNKFLGRFLCPQTVAIMGFGMANITAQLVTGKYMRYGVLATMGLLAPTMAPAVAGIATGCLIGGLFTAMRKNKETLYHKAQKERRQALDYRPDDDKKGLRPNQASASRFERRLEDGDRLYHKENASTLTANITGAATFDALRDALAQAIALNQMSERGINRDDTLGDGQTNRLDLIRFDGQGSIESQRLAMVHAISQGKIRLRGLPGGRDADGELDTQRMNEQSRILGEMHTTEANFGRLKRWENLKAAGIGAIIGGSVSALLGLLIHHDTSTETIKNLTASGKVDQAGLISLLKGSGLSDAEIKANIHFDPKTGGLDPAALAFLKSKNIDVHSFLTPGTASSVTDALHSGGTMTQAELIRELGTKGITLAPTDFDSSGHLTAAALARLSAAHVTIAETLVPGVPTTVTGDKLSTIGFKLLDHLHFNDNQPHAPNSHIWDELRLWWANKPEIGSDGKYHFSIKEMFNKNLTRSNLPPGVTMPSDPTKMQIGLQIDAKGTDGITHHYWKFFQPDQNGQVAIPGEYLRAPVVYVPRGGSVLPGLRTDAIGVAFETTPGHYEMLASVRGDGSYIPAVTDGVNYTGSIVTEAATPGSALFDATRKVTETVREHLVPPPIIGDKMNHLEYGKKEEETGTDEGTDTGGTDTGSSDSGSSDGGTDTGSSDSGSSGGGTDTGSSDSGSSDGGTDTGSSDSGSGSGEEEGTGMPPPK